MRLKLPVFQKRGKLWAILMWKETLGGRVECLAVSESGDRAEVYMEKQELDRLEVRAFRMVDS